MTATGLNARRQARPCGGGNRSLLLLSLRALLVGLLCCMALGMAAAQRSPSPKPSPSSKTKPSPSPKTKPSPTPSPKPSPSLKPSPSPSLKPSPSPRPSPSPKTKPSPSPSRIAITTKPKEVPLSVAIPKGSYQQGCSYGGSGKCLGQPASFRLQSGATQNSVPLLEGMTFTADSDMVLTKADFKLVLSAPWNATLYTTKASSIQFTAWLYTVTDGSGALTADNADLVAFTAPSTAKLTVSKISNSKDQPNTKLSFAFNWADPKWTLSAGNTYFLGISSADTVFCSVAVPAATVPATVSNCKYPTADFCKPPMRDCTYTWRIYNGVWGRSNRVIAHVDVYGAAL